MKRKIDVFDYAGHICKSLSKGVLMTTAHNDTVNTMTIGWGKIGIEWGLPIFAAYVRESRYTKEMLEHNGEFTINVPYGEFDNRILGVCGTKSGRDTDKFAELGLITEPPEVISVPGIRQLPLTLECKVIYRQEQELDAMPASALERFYPKDSEGKRDCHTVFFGQIVDAYIIE